MKLLGLGLYFFGIVSGLVTALSAYPGISQTFLSTLFSFIGGGLLAFIGFKADTPGRDFRTLGVALLTLSLGILSGLGGGLGLREMLPRNPSTASASMRQDSPSPATKSESLDSRSRLGLYSNLSGQCAAIQNLQGQRDSVTLEEALALLEVLQHAICEHPSPEPTHIHE